MKSHALRRFWHMYEALPSEVQEQARKAFALFSANPSHPSVHFKPLQGYANVWSARVTISYRAVCKRDGDNVHWFWIGSHADFDKQFG